MPEYIESQIRKDIEDAIFNKKKIPKQEEILHQYDLREDQLKIMANIHQVMESLWGFSNASIKIFHEKNWSRSIAPKNFDLIKYITAQVELELSVKRLKEMDEQ